MKTIAITVRTSRATRRPTKHDAKETADIRSVATKDRAAYAARRKEVIANGGWLRPVPSLSWWVADETEERRVAQQVREEAHVGERFRALAECF
jgi:hypothetical protein